MKKTSRVRQKSRVRCETPMVQCRRMLKGRCGTADRKKTKKVPLASGICELTPTPSGFGESYALWVWMAASDAVLAHLLYAWILVDE